MEESGVSLEHLISVRSQNCEPKITRVVDQVTDFNLVQAEAAR